MDGVIFCMKMIGSSCIIVSGISIGWIYGGVIEKRYIELNELYRNFRMIYSEISYGGSSFLEIIRHVHEQSRDEFDNLYVYIEEELQNKTKRRFTDIWSEGIDRELQALHLLETDIYELKRVGQSLGNVDMEQQLSMIQLYLNKLEMVIENLGREKDKKIKLYRMLGTLGSVFVVVILL